MDGAQALLRHLVGRAGAEALQHAPSVPGLHAYVLPRAAYVWVDSLKDTWAAIDGYGEISFAKSHSGYTGFVKTSGIEHSFRDLSAVQLAATIVVLAGQQEAATPPDKVMVSVSKTIQNLIKSEAEKTPAPAKTYKVTSSVSGDRIYLSVRLGTRLCGEVDVNVSGDVPVVERWDVIEEPEAECAALNALSEIKPINKRGADEPSPPQKPAMTGAPLGFMEPDKMTVKKSVWSAPKAAQIRVKHQQAERKCSCCGSPNWAEGRFVGCYCFRDLAPLTKSHQEEGEIVLEVEGWSERDVLSFLERMA